MKSSGSGTSPAPCARCVPCAHAPICPRPPQEEAGQNLLLEEAGQKLLQAPPDELATQQQGQGQQQGQEQGQGQGQQQGQGQGQAGEKKQKDAAALVATYEAAQEAAALLAKDGHLHRCAMEFIILTCDLVVDMGVIQQFTQNSIGGVGPWERGVGRRQGLRDG